MDQRQIDISGLNIYSIGDEEKVIEEPPKMVLAREKVIEEAKKALDARGETDKRGVSLVIVGKTYCSHSSNALNDRNQATLMLGNRH
jgi:elongation factor 1 alpha-like protein